MLRRRWDDGAALDAIDRGLRGPTIPTDRGWYVSPSGQTFAIVRGPVSFRMGTVPGTDPYAGGDESLHERTIGRSFAIGTREVSLAEFRLFLRKTPISGRSGTGRPSGCGSLRTTAPSAP